MKLSPRQRWRAVPISDSLRQLERLMEELDPLNISFLEPRFGIDRHWRRAFLNSLIRKKYDKVFAALPKIDTLEKADIDLFSRLNFNLTLSLESGSKEMIKNMNKSNDPRGYLDRCKEVILYANKKRIQTRIPVIINHPGETPATFNETLDFFRSLFSQCDSIMFEVCPSLFYINPGSALYRNLRGLQRKFGTRINEPGWWRVSDGRDHHLLATDVIASRQLEKEDNRGYWKDGIAQIMGYCASNRAAERRMYDLAQKALRRR
jgi:radical SAM superfamily enzyme YgiQ (UPF0313 family)